MDSDEIKSEGWFKDTLKNGWYRGRGTNEQYDAIRDHDLALRRRVRELEMALENAGTGAGLSAMGNSGSE
jgi:hypothetical protein